MEGYVRFSNASTSPQPSRANSMRYPYGVDSESGSDPPTPTLSPLREERLSWVSSVTSNIWRRLHPPAPAPYESQYLTLIPLSDARLRPRQTKLIVSSLLLLAVTAVVCVFLAVPRGVSIGSIDVHSTKMTFNSTTLTYRIILQADVPVYNPNYLKVSVIGSVSVSFFDAEAGWSDVGPVTVAARTEPTVLSVKVDASNLPRKYTQVVYTHCFNFPRKIIFFLMANFQARYLGYTVKLPDIDTYFMLDCSGAKDLAAPEPGQLPAITAEALLQQQQQQPRYEQQRWLVQQQQWEQRRNQQLQSGAAGQTLDVAYQEQPESAEDVQ